MPVYVQGKGGKIIEDRARLDIPPDYERKQVPISTSPGLHTHLPSISTVLGICTAPVPRRYIYLGESVSSERAELAELADIGLGRFWRTR